MSEKRKDNRGRILKTGERQRKDGTYQFRYTDPMNKRKTVYARTLQDLRKKEDEKRHDFYISKVSRKAPWIYISYIAEVFYHLEDDIFLAAHQNRREAVRIVKVLNEMGYNVYIQKYDSERELPNIKNVKVVFGLPPNLNDAADKYKEAIVVLYNTGAFVSHHNSQIIRMTDIVNAKYGSTIPYRRLDNEYPELMSYKIADKILHFAMYFLRRASFHTSNLIG